MKLNWSNIGGSDILFNVVWHKYPEFSINEQGQTNQQQFLRFKKNKRAVPNKVPAG